MKNASFYLVQTVLSKMAHHGTLCSMLERSIEKLAKSTTFMSAFTSRALISSQFVQLLAKRIRTVIKMESEKVDSIGKNLEVSFPSRSTSSSVSETSPGVEPHKHATDKRKKTDKPHNEERKDRCTYKKSLSPFSSWLNLLSSKGVSETDYIMTKAE